MSDGVLRTCPVADCTWTWVEEPITRWLVHPTDPGLGISRTVAAHQARTDAHLAEHAATHTPVDYLRTIALLRQALGTARPGHPLLAMTAQAIVPSSTSWTDVTYV